MLRVVIFFLLFLVLTSLWSLILLGFLHLSFSLTGPRTMLFPAHCDVRTPSFFLTFFQAAFLRC
jgi:hypothetical protein